MIRAPKDRYWLYALMSTVAFAVLAALGDDRFWLLFATVTASACLREWIKANRTQQDR